MSLKEASHSAGAVYQLLLDESVRHALPVHYREDLTVHDKRALENDGPAKFVWVLRECGTHLIPPGDRNPLSLLEAVERGYGSQGVHYYIYNEGALQACNYEAAHLFLEENWTPPPPVFRLTVHHFDQNDLTAAENAALEYLRGWCKDDFDRLAVHREGANDFVACYSNSHDERRYTIGAIFDEAKGSYSFHS